MKWFDGGNVSIISSHQETFLGGIDSYGGSTILCLGWCQVAGGAGWGQSWCYGEGGACEKKRTRVSSWKPAAVGRWTKKQAQLLWLQWNQDLGCGQERLMSWGVGWGMVWTPWYITAIQALWMLVSGPFTKVIFCKGVYVHPTFPDPLTNKDSPHPPACQFSHLEDQRVWRFFSFKIFLMTGGRLL